MFRTKVKRSVGKVKEKRREGKEWKVLSLNGSKKIFLIFYFILGM